MDIKDLVWEAHELAQNKGWWDGYGPIVPGSSPTLIASKLCLIHSEISEALEEVRDGNLSTYWMMAGIRCDDESQTVPGQSKPEGLPIELADTVIRIADLCGALGIDLDEAIRTKLKYNATRKHRHGGRAL